MHNPDDYFIPFGFHKPTRQAILAAYRSRTIILPRIEGCREKVIRHRKITYRLIYKKNLKHLLRLQ